MLEKRITRLEDIEAIRLVTNRYHAGINERDFEAIWSVFAPNATAILGNGIEQQGLPAIKANLPVSLNRLKFIKQFIHSHVVDVELDAAEATGYSFLEARYARHDDPASYMVAAKLDYRYVKSAGKWLISYYKVGFYFVVPIEVGWSVDDLVRY